MEILIVVLAIFGAMAYPLYPEEMLYISAAITVTMGVFLLYSIQRGRKQWQEVLKHEYDGELLNDDNNDFMDD
ncbi:MAG: hypothetical protein ACSHWQ_07050 [Spongiibacteraceae bacterium]